MAQPSVALRRAVLDQVPPGIRKPRYDAARVGPGIVHVGLGGFHRAHMARYTHDTMEADASALSWGIVGAGLMPGDKRLIEALAAQEGLYTLVERVGTQEAATLIGALSRVVFAGEDSSDLLDAIDGAPIRIVSLTVTAGPSRPRSGISCCR